MCCGYAFGSFLIGGGAPPLGTAALAPPAWALAPPAAASGTWLSVSDCVGLLLFTLRDIVRYLSKELGEARPV